MNEAHRYDVEPKKEKRKGETKARHKSKLYNSVLIELRTGKTNRWP